MAVTPFVPLTDYVAYGPNSTDPLRVVQAILADAPSKTALEDGLNLSGGGGGGNSNFYMDRALAAAATIPAESKQITVVFHSATLFSGGGNYRRVSFAELSGIYPAASYFRSVDIFMPDGTSDAVNGGYWLLDDDNLNYAQFGAHINLADNSAQIQAAWNHSAVSKRRVRGQGGDHLCLTPINMVSGMDVNHDGKFRLLGNFSGTLITQASFDTALSNVRFTGGSFGRPNFGFTGKIFYFRADDSLFENVEIKTYAGGQAFYWAGDRTGISKCRVLDSAFTTGTGAYRYIGGTDSWTADCYGESGDDVFQVAPQAQGVSPLFDMSVSRFHYTQCHGHSTRGRLIVVLLVNNGGVSNMTGSIRDCKFEQISGRCGGDPVSAAIIIENEDSSGEIDNIIFRNITVDCIDQPDSGVLPAVLIYLTNVTSGTVKNILLDDVRIRGQSGPAMYVSKCQNVTIRGFKADKPRNPALTVPTVRVYLCDNFTIENSEVGAIPTMTGVAIGNNQGPCVNVTVKNLRVTGVMDDGALTSALSLANVNRALIDGFEMTIDPGATALMVRGIGVTVPTAGLAECYITRGDLTEANNPDKVNAPLDQKCIVERVRGFATESNGFLQWNNGLSQLTISHGLERGINQEQIHIMFRASTVGAGGPVWITDITASDFTVHSPAPMSQNTAIAWRVDAREYLL